MTTPTTTIPGELAPPRRVLMGPGPSDVSYRVLRAMATPLLGHLDPRFVKLMDDVQGMLRTLFSTGNRMTLPISGTGSAGMETCFVNLIEPGDTVVVGVNGVFGTRMADVAGRCGATVHKVEAPWGEIVPDDAMIAAIQQHRPKVVGLVHAETSTGVHQPVQAIARAAREAGSMVVLDCVTSLGGMPVQIDEWGIDAAYSGTQKCLSCPPGLAPVTLSDRAMDALRNRKTKVQSWYLDLTMLAQYWGTERVYHHTAPISMNYALFEALRMVFEEGLEARYARHAKHHTALMAGLQAIGLEPAAQAGHRLPMLNAIRVPEGVDDAKLRRSLLDDNGIEIGAGLGPLKGKTLRIGLMGESCTRNHVLLLLGAMESALRAQGAPIKASGTAAALAAWS
ncbi:MAG: alanine--glyoxylate aminotransferase family protein [Planctomycetota bacterium]